MTTAYLNPPFKAGLIPVRGARRLRAARSIQKPNQLQNLVNKRLMIFAMRAARDRSAT